MRKKRLIRELLCRVGNLEAREVEVCEVIEPVRELLRRVGNLEAREVVDDRTETPVRIDNEVRRVLHDLANARAHSFDPMAGARSIGRPAKVDGMASEELQRDRMMWAREVRVSERKLIIGYLRTRGQSGLALAEDIEHLHLEKDE